MNYQSRLLLIFLAILPAGGSPKSTTDHITKKLSLGAIGKYTALMYIIYLPKIITTSLSYGLPLSVDLFGKLIETIEEYKESLLFTNNQNARMLSSRTYCPQNDLVICNLITAHSLKSYIRSGLLRSGSRLELRYHRSIA